MLDVVSPTAGIYPTGFITGGLYWNDSHDWELPASQGSSFLLGTTLIVRKLAVPPLPPFIVSTEEKSQELLFHLVKLPFIWWPFPFLKHSGMFRVKPKSYSN